jgi:hypothetical protein
MYIHGYSTSANIVKDLATVLTTGDLLVPTNNWTLVDPVLIGDVVDSAVLKASTKVLKEWVKREAKTIATGAITLTNTLATGGGTRVYIKDKKYYLYLKEDAGNLDLMEYRVNGNTLEFNTALNGKDILVSYEKTVNTTKYYFLKLTKPETTSIGGSPTPNHYYINWEIGEGYDDVTHTFPTDHSCASLGKIHWFKQNEVAQLVVKSWTPIEYWISFDNNAVVGVLMGDPGLSPEYMSSPFYFGAVKQIDGALETDLIGNFGGFGGSYSEPLITKLYGDYTGTGMIDVVMAATKTGRPYQAHKVSVFGGYEFREKTFNGISHHTGKHPVSDIVVGDVHENDRGMLQHCLAVPKVGVEHGTELIFNRFVSGKEETYIFLLINAFYTPFNTGPDVLLGLALRTDI